MPLIFDWICPAIAVVKSEEGTILFPIRELVLTFEKKVLCPIIYLCAERLLFLDDWWNL